MPAYAILGIILGIPLLLGMLFRVGSSQIFFSILASELLARTFGDEASRALRTVTSPEIAQYAPMGILILPLLLTAVFMRHTLTHSKLALHAIPLAITGVIFAAFALHELPPNLHDQIEGIEIGKTLIKQSETIIGVVVFLQLISLWLLNRAHGHSSKKGK